MICLCGKIFCSYDSQSNKFEFSSKGLSKETLEDCGDVPMSKRRKVFGKIINVTSNK